MPSKQLETIIIHWYERGYSAQETANLLKKPVNLIQDIINQHEHQQQADRSNPITQIHFSHKEHQ